MIKWERWALRMLSDDKCLCWNHNSIWHQLIYVCLIKGLISKFIMKNYITHDPKVRSVRMGIKIARKAWFLLFPLFCPSFPLALHQSIYFCLTVFLSGLNTSTTHATFSLSQPSFLHFHIFYIFLVTLWLSCLYWSLWLKWIGLILFSCVLMSASQISDKVNSGHCKNWRAFLTPSPSGLEKNVKNAPPRGAIMFLLSINCLFNSKSFILIGFAYWTSLDPSENQCRLKAP